MKRRGVFGLLLLFVALAGIAVFQMQPTVQPTIGELQATATMLGTPIFTRVYPDMAVLDIQAIRLRSPISNQEFVISRGADGDGRHQMLPQKKDWTPTPRLI